MIKHFYLFVVLFFHLGLTAQNQEEIKRTPYLLIDENINLNCQNYPYTKNWENAKIKKVKFDNVYSFFICRHQFSAKEENIEVIDTEQFEKYSLWSFGQMQYERLRKGYIQFNYCFEKIYFIEKIGIGKYKKYLVEWEPAINMNRVDIDSKY